MPRASREVLSVGIDVGTTTTQVVFSQLSLQDVARPGQVPRIQVDERSVVFRSDVHRTPLRSPDEVDAAALADLVARDYALAGIDRSAIETGAVIITGETARTSNADAILTALSATAGDFVVTVAGPNAEAQIAGGFAFRVRPEQAATPQARRVVAVRRGDGEQGGQRQFRRRHHVLSRVLLHYGGLTAVRDCRA